MLNELSHLAASLAQCGIQLPPSHPKVKQPGRAEALWVRLGDGARIQTVEYLSADRMAQLWTIREGKHNSFPCVTVPRRTEAARDSPFRKQLREVAAHDLRERAQLLRRWLLEAERPNAAKFDARWLGLRERASQLLHLDWPSPKLGAWRALLDSVARSQVVGRDWFEQLASESVAACLDGRLSCIGLVETLVEVLVVADAKDGKLVRAFTLFLDVADVHRYGLPVAHTDVAPHVAAAVTAAEGDSGGLGTCALSGQQLALETRMFPAPKLPRMGETYLLSMNKDAPCQTRYGLTGTSVLPVGRALVANIENAVKWITDHAREGRTWRAVPGVAPGERDLLLAYLERLPMFDAELAAIFSCGGGDAGGAVGKASFEAACRNVVASLDANRTVTPSDAVCLMVLRKVDKGRAQVVLSRAITVEALTDAALEWRLQCSRNLPSSGSWLPGKKGEKRKWIGPPVLFPDEAVELLGKQWQREGTENQKVSSCRLQEAFDLFLPTPGGCKPTARRLLALQLQRAWALLAGLGHRDRREDRDPKALGREPGGTRLVDDQHRRIEALKHLSLMGTLLYRLDQKKEIYMSEAAFKLGELLALADGLHKDYCQARRKGDYPPQLLGNALLPSAANAPARALARLAERLRIYQAWAATSEVALARWRLGRFGEISRSLHDLGIPECLDDAGKAELLLGYLAKQGKSEKQETESEAQERSGGDDDV